MKLPTGLTIPQIKYLTGGIVFKVQVVLLGAVSKMQLMNSITIIPEAKKLFMIFSKKYWGYKNGKIMIIFSQSKVELLLASGLFSEWEKVKYFIFAPVISALLGGPIFFVTPRFGTKPSLVNSLATMSCGVLIAMVTYLGIRHLYLTNQSIDGKSFIERCTILSVPVFIKFTMAGMPIFFVLLFVAASLTHESPGSRDVVPIFFNIVYPLIMVWYYIVLNRSFKRFGKITESRTAEEGVIQKAPIINGNE